MKKTNAPTTTYQKLRADKDNTFWVWANEERKKALVQHGLKIQIHKIAESSRKDCFVEKNGIFINEEPSYTKGRDLIEKLYLMSGDIAEKLVMMRMTDFNKMREITESLPEGRAAFKLIASACETIASVEFSKYFIVEVFNMGDVRIIPTNT